jgi:hypothetical protein
LNLVRVALRDDERVAQSVAHLALDRRCDSWLQELSKRSEEFLHEYARKRGVEPANIKVGMAVAKLRAESADQRRLEVEISERQALVTELEKELNKVEARNVSDTYHELRADIEVLVAEIAEKRDLAGYTARRVRIADAHLKSLGDSGEQLSQMSESEQGECEEMFLAGDEQAKACHRLAQLSEEWQLRFGRSSDFHAALVTAADVVAGTCVGFARVRGILSIDFDTCIVDEASKATPTELLVPLTRARRWIVVGDRKQLPPFVEDLLVDKHLLEEHDVGRETLERTLLDRLVEMLPSPCVTTLTRQHRMIRPIGDLISKCFYDGVLESVNDKRDERLAMVLKRPVVWLSTESCKGRYETYVGSSYRNMVEVRQVVALLKRFGFAAKAADTKYEVAVIAAYSAQLAELEREIRPLAGELPLLDIECNTVDAFQGREADICIYSVTRCNNAADVGFLRDSRRLNVALSRARVGLVIVGDAGFCRHARPPNPFRRVLDHIEQNPGDAIIEEVKA